jgi:hypothetical protein
MQFPLGEFYPYADECRNANDRCVHGNKTGCCDKCCK